MPTSRRDFLKQKLVAGASLAFLPAAAASVQEPPSFSPLAPEKAPLATLALDLSPAQWIWMKAGRTLPNTILQFRKSFNLGNVPDEAMGFIVADSRYRLWVNGQRVQFGPAPCDPRWAEADPVDLKPYLNSGENVIGVEVLYYGMGEGTWPIGKPGFLFKVMVGDLAIISDESWHVHIAKSWPPGHYKRSYVRCFQEEFDARKYPYGWTEAGFNTDSWRGAYPIPDSSADKPIISSGSRDYLYDAGGKIEQAQLRKRSIPLMKEERREVANLQEAFTLSWHCPPEDFFEFALDEADCFSANDQSVSALRADTGWGFTAVQGTSKVLTFSMAEQCIGFPQFTINAPEGSVVELLVHEAHAVGGSHRMLNTHFHSWSRFICREGRNQFETFDYESVMWIQVHIHNAQGQVNIESVGVRRRYHPFPQAPVLRCGDKKLEALFAACVNTIYNQSQETIVDGMARERQQYSGDIGHVLHPLMAGFGGVALAARYCNTFSQGISKTGYFLDCWPAADRLIRIMEREIGMTEWGPLLDHGVGFVFDCYHLYLHTGDPSLLTEVFPRLKTFFHYLMGLRAADGMVPVDGLGIPVIWLDHLAFKQQRHKHCAFNLYIAGMLLRALAPLAAAFEDAALAKEAQRLGRKIAQASARKYLSAEDGTFVCNLPWLSEEGAKRYDDRSLSMLVLFDLFPTLDLSPTLDILADTPAELGMSYATNAIWRYWALAKGGRMDIILPEFREKWMEMPSVLANNTMGEWFDLQPDTRSQWSHAAVAPLICLYTSILGIKPLEPGCGVVEIRPQLGDLAHLKTQYQTPLGPIICELSREGAVLTGFIQLPPDMTATLVIGESKSPGLTNTIYL